MPASPTPIAQTAAAPGYAAAADGYKAFADRQYAESARLAREAIRLEPGRASYRLLLVDSLLQTGERDEARRALREALALDDARNLDALDMANRALQLGDDELALSQFERARDAEATSGAAANRQPLTAEAALNAAYTAGRIGREGARRDWLRLALSLDETRSAKLQDTQRRAAQDELALAEKRWGGSLLLYRGGSGLAVGGLPSTGQRKVTQAGGELYYRPGVHLLPSDGGVEFFGRYFQTLDDMAGAPTGADTGQAQLGVRWRPWREVDAVVEVARLVKVGDVSRNDTMLRAAYGAGTPLLQTGRAWRFYAEYDYFTETKLTLAMAQLEAGWRIRGDGSSSGAGERVGPWFPHVVLATSYDDSFMKPNATSAGVGISKSFALGQGVTAPWVDVSLQYRWRVAGDAQRAQGVFLVTSLRF